jgi:ParB family chromosome partitioning protein
MIDREAGYSGEKSGSSLAASPPSDPVFGFKTPGAAATIARAEAAEALDRSWIAGKTRAERFDAFRTLADEARAAWLGHAVARTLEASLNLAGERSCAFHDHLGRLIGVEVARWWRPTGGNFFDRVPKSVTLAALAEVGGPEFVSRYSSANKAELAQSCERIFAGDFIGEMEVKEAALAWVPEAMRFAPAPAPLEPESSDCKAAIATGETIVDEDSSAQPVDEIEKAA